MTKKLLFAVGLLLIVFALGFYVLGGMQDQRWLAKALGGANVALFALWVPANKAVNSRWLKWSVVYLIFIAGGIAFLLALRELSALSLNVVSESTYFFGAALLMVQAVYALWRPWEKEGP